MDFTGKTVVITGSASGMGRACAFLYASKGANVIISDYNFENASNVVKKIEKDGGISHAIQCDVTKEDSVENLMQEAILIFKKIDVLINGAGISSVGEFKPVHETPFEEWKKIINTNLNGVFLTTKYALPNMMENKEGNIVNFGSTYSYLSAPKLGAYSTTKGGIIQFTRNIAYDYAPYNIRANAVCPGFIDTSMLNKDISKNDDPSSERKKIEERTPLKRLGTAEEMAEVVFYLTSDKATYFTGSMIVSDGGYSIV